MVRYDLRYISLNPNRYRSRNTPYKKSLFLQRIFNQTVSAILPTTHYCLSQKPNCYIAEKLYPN